MAGVDENFSFGYWLRRQRLARDLRQNDLAAQLGVATVTLRKLEADERRPSLQLITRVAEVFALSDAERDLLRRVARADLSPAALPLPERAEDEAPALITRAQPTTNLPAQPTALIGRAQEVAAIVTLLRRAAVRLVTLTGPGGVGKTRLGLQVAAELIGDFADGVYFVDLASIREPSQAASAIAAALGVRESAGQPLLATLKAYLHDKRLLLLLDNFEHLLDAAVLVAELLQAAAQLKVLVTSRELLHLRGEKELVVQPLALPEQARLPACEQLSQYGAVALLIERARDARLDFEVTNANAPAVAEICARLDGLPLAIELAAARLKLLTPEALLARLSSRLPVLTGGPRDLPARQQTIRSTIDWSYDLLTDAEQTLFRRLGVFVGGCTLQAAEAIGNANRDLAIEVVNGISALLDKSLIQQSTAGDEPRYTMLETIREFALERLAASGEAEATSARHASYFLELAERAEPRLHSPEATTWLNRLEVEHDNLRSAITWCQLELGDSELELRLVGALSMFWWLRGHVSEGRAWLENALERRCNVSAQTRAKALIGAGTLARNQDDVARMMTAGEESLRIYRSLEDIHGIANSLHLLGRAAHDQRDLEQATALFEEALALFRELRDTWGIWVTLINLGWTLYDQGNYPQALAVFEECLVLGRAVGVGAVAASLHWLGRLALIQGDDQRAGVLFNEQLGLERKMGHKIGVAGALQSLGDVARYRSDYAIARKHYEESAALYREIGDKTDLAEVLSALGYVAQHEGDLQAMAAYIKESLILSHEVGDAADLARCFEGLGGVVLAQGLAERGARLFGVADVLLGTMNLAKDPNNRTDYLRNLAATRAQLDTAAFEAAWAAGRALSVEAATAEALEWLTSAQQWLAPASAAAPRQGAWG